MSEVQNPLAKTLQLTLSAQALQKAVRQKLQHTARTHARPGFRPGKVPIVLIERDFKQQFEQELLQDMIWETFLADIKEHQWHVANQPKIVVKSMEPEIVVEASFEVLPVIAPTEWPRLIIPHLKPLITDEHIDQEIEKMRNKNKIYHAIDSEAAAGDRLRFDFEIQVDGKLLDGGHATDITMVLEEQQLLPGFIQGLVGHQAGQSGEFHFVFPDDYHHQLVAGKDAVVTFTIHEVERGQLPELTDDWVKSVTLDKVTDVNSLRQDIKEQMLDQALQAAKLSRRYQLLSAWRQAVPFAIPESIVEKEIALLREMNDRQLNQDSSTDAQVKKTLSPEEEKMLRPVAEKRVANHLLIQAYSKANEVQVSEQAFRQVIDNYMQQSDAPHLLLQQIQTNKQLLDQIQEQAHEDSVIEHLMAHYVDQQESEVPWDKYFNALEESVEKQLTTVDHIGTEGESL